MYRFILIIAVFTYTSSCQQNNKNKVDIKKTEELSYEEEKNASEENIPTLSNPALILGTDLGTLFKTYYNVGDFNAMLRYTDKSTLDHYGRDSLIKIYRKLNLGFEMRLRNITSEKNEKILHYEIMTYATKSVKRLHVVIENDTARIVPQNLQTGEIFE